MSDGTVEAMNGISTVNGTWSITSISGDDKLEALVFNMEFSGELAEFNRSWDVEDFHDDIIELIGDLELIDCDYITFEKL